MFTCLKLNKAQTPPANSFEELEDFRQLAIKEKLVYPLLVSGCL